jgi:RNA polymerase sigma-70 factor (ECF subfamily)
MADPTKLTRWFDAYAAPLVLYARQWLRSGRARAAEDVVQEAFVKLMAQRRDPTNVKAWLHATVRNAAISESRSASRRQTRESRVAATAEWFARDPTDLLDAEAVRMALEALPLRQREVVVLRIWSEMTLAEIAQVTGVATSTCFEEYRRALESIRRAMEMTCDVKTNTK